MFDINFSNELNNGFSQHMQNAKTCGFDVASIAGTEMGYNAQDSRDFMESSQDEDIPYCGWLRNPASPWMVETL
jgi:hypothetical protein